MTTEPRGDRRAEERERRRAEILDAAAAVIAEKGIDGFTFGDVARLARWSRPLVYVYFPTREELLHALMERAMRELLARFRRAAGGLGSGLDRTMAIGRAYHRFALERSVDYDLLMRLNASESGDPEGDGPEACCLRLGREIIGVIARTLGEGIADGSVRPDIGDPALTAISLWAHTHGLIQIARTKEEAILRDHQVGAEVLLEHGFALIRASLRR